VQTVSEIVTENVWFSKYFKPYVKQVSRLPFDHHMLAGMFAPRGHFVIENTSMEWLGNLSIYGCMKIAQIIWQALGVGDSMGFSQVGNHNHCAFPSSQQGDLNAFVNKFLLRQSTNTAIMKTDGMFSFNQAYFQYPSTRPTTRQISPLATPLIQILKLLAPSILTLGLIGQRLPKFANAFGSPRYSAKFNLRRVDTA